MCPTYVCVLLGNSTSPRKWLAVLDLEAVLSLLKSFFLPRKDKLRYGKIKLDHLFRTNGPYNIFKQEAQGPLPSAFTCSHCQAFHLITQPISQSSDVQITMYYCSAAPEF